MSATCTCHRQVFLPHKGVASCWSRSWPAASFPSSSSSSSSPDVLLLSRGLGALAAVAGGEELDLLGFFQTRELTKPEKLIHFPVPIILFVSQIGANPSSAWLVLPGDAAAFQDVRPQTQNHTRRRRKPKHDPSAPLTCPNRSYFEFLLLYLHLPLHLLPITSSNCFSSCPPPHPTGA